ncbi:MAG: spermidine/putrescine ABC transporter substrate-binding protein [Clostridia bacterium]|nr:spermidine/putrescine ABC transporter substrate-binding protein [Clostridia bacterium]
MKKFLLVFIFIFLNIFSFNCTASNESINVYSWGEFISNGADKSVNVNTKFTEETGIKVNYKTFQNNEELFAKISGGGADYDVIIPSDYMISRLIEKNMLAKINFENIPNYKFILPQFKNLNFDPKNEYSVPYMWGVIGIFYNKNEVKEKINWDILWNEKYKNKILMFDNARDSFAISLLRMGESINTTDKNIWRKAADELIIQKPLVQAYVMDQIFDKMDNAEAVLAPYYAGDAAAMIKSNPNIGFVIPEEGTNRFIDSMCIPKNSKNKELAEKYINFMCRTDIALANVKKTGYSTPHSDAYNLLDDEIKSSPIFYPDKNIIEKSQIFINLPEDINKYIDELWVEVKSGGTSENSWFLFVFLVCFGIIYLSIFLYKKKKIKKN